MSVHSVSESNARWNSSAKAQKEPFNRGREGKIGSKVGWWSREAHGETCVEKS